MKPFDLMEALTRPDLVKCGDMDWDVEFVQALNESFTFPVAVKFKHSDKIYTFKSDGKYFSDGEHELDLHMRDELSFYANIYRSRITGNLYITASHSHERDALSKARSLDDTNLVKAAHKFTFTE